MKAHIRNTRNYASERADFINQGVEKAMKNPTLEFAKHSNPHKLIDKVWEQPYGLGLYRSERRK